LNNRIIVKINDSAILSENWALKDHCELRKWCHINTKCKWHSYFVGTTDDNRAMRGVGLVVFEFGCPKEALKFKLWAGT